MKISNGYNKYPGCQNNNERIAMGIFIGLLIIVGTFGILVMAGVIVLTDYEY